MVGNNIVVKDIDFPVLFLLCGCKQYVSRHTYQKVVGTRLTEVDYKNEGLATNKDKSVSKVIMTGSR